MAEAVRDVVGDVDIVHTEGRPGDFGRKEVSSERAATELGWMASTPFAEGVRRYVAWRSDRPDEDRRADVDLALL
jgi:UDP-glucose 4-epimerase